MKVVLNSVTSQLPESVDSGKAFTIQIAPKGEYPQFVDDPETGKQKEVMQILDETAINTLVSNFKDKVLVDADHSSENSTNTAAMGWVTKLFVDPEKGLMAEIEPTSEGAEKINGKVYRFVSGAWTLDDDGRPVELVSVGLTNKPNLPVQPMINSQVVGENKDGLGVTDDDGTAESSASLAAEDNVNADAQEPEANTDDYSHIENKETYQGNENMETLKEKLGLAPDATDEEVYAAIDALIERCGQMEEVTNTLGLEPTATNEEVQEALNAVLNQCGELQAQNEEMEQARLGAEADELIAENEDVIPEESVEEIREEYIADPEAAKATVANMRRIYDRAVLNATRASRDVAPKAVVIRNSDAKRPVVATNMVAILNSCGNDPAKINEAIALMAKRG